MGRAPKHLLARFVVAVFVIVALAPLWLGPALAPINVALGASAHVCACGMKAGTCGCPECARAELDRNDEHAPDALPVLKGGCHDDEVFASAAVPPFVLPGTFAHATISGSEEVTSRAPFTARSADRVPPPTPPPRTTV